MDLLGDMPDSLVLTYMVPVHQDYSTCLTTESSRVYLLQRLFLNPSYLHFPNPNSFPTTFKSPSLYLSHFDGHPHLNTSSSTTALAAQCLDMLTNTLVHLSPYCVLLFQPHEKSTNHPSIHAQRLSNLPAIKSSGYLIFRLSPYLYLIQAFRVNSPSQLLITSNYATVDLQPLVYLPSSHHAVGKQRLGRQCWTWMFIENRRNSTRCSAVPSGFRLFFRFCSNRSSAFGDSRFVDATAGNSAAGARNKPTTMSHRPRPF